MQDPRPTIRCPHCDLNQFETKDKMCRRCREPLHPREVKPEAQVQQPTRDERELHMLHAHAWPFSIRYVPTILCMLRTALRLSQRKLSARIGCPRTYITKIENGRCCPTLATLPRYCAALEVPVEGVLALAEMAGGRAA